MSTTGPLSRPSSRSNVNDGQILSMYFDSIRDLKPLSLCSTSTTDFAILHAGTALTCSADTLLVSLVWSGHQSMNSS